MTMITRDFLQQLPKAELHLHLEGTLSPELKLRLAEKNNIDIGQTTLAEIEASYEFDDLASFLGVYYPAMNVLQTESDFYDLAMDYLKTAQANNVRHVEMFFDPQAHTSRGIEFATVITGLHRAIEDGRALGVDAHLIMCFLRDLSKESAYQTLEQAEPYRDWILGVGLDSDEHNNPPLKFAGVFEKAASQGYHLTMHCDVDQVDSIQHIQQALEIIEVERLDHGTNIIENPDLVNFVKNKHIGMTTCPKSNRLVSDSTKGAIILDLLHADVKVTLNSDDPAYFGGSVLENFWTMVQDFELSQDDVVKFAKNSFDISWISPEAKAIYHAEIEDFVANYQN